MSEKKGYSLEKPKTVELEEGEVIIRRMYGGNLGSSAAKQILKSSTYDYGHWYVTNRRVIYEGKKSGDKAVVADILLGGIGHSAMMEEDILAVRIKDIIDMEIVPYAMLDKVLKITYKDNQDTKVLYVGVPVVVGEESTLTKFREDILTARDFVSCAKYEEVLEESKAKTERSYPETETSYRNVWVVVILIVIAIVAYLYKEYLMNL